MPIRLFDNYTIDAQAVRETADGYLVATPRVARTGIQLYYGRELGLTGKDAEKVVKVYRSEEEVFSTDSMATYPHKPVCDDHPPVTVNADNWSKYSRGQIGDDVARDGDCIRVPMAMMDAGLINKYRGGKAEISMGYTCDLDWQTGKTPDGETFDAQQRNIRINHMAVVDTARGGPKLTIGDGTGAKVDIAQYAVAFDAIHKRKTIAAGAAQDCYLDTGRKYAVMLDGKVSLESLRAHKTDTLTRNDGDVLAAIDTLLSRCGDTTGKPTAANDAAFQQRTTTMKTMVIDGITIEVGDGNASEVINKHIATTDTLSKKLKDAEMAATEAATASEEAIKALEAKVAELTTQIATLTEQLAAEEMSEEELDRRATDRASVIATAKTVLGDGLKTDRVKTTDIKKAVVAAKVGDASKGWNDEQIKVSFDTIAVGLAASNNNGGSANLLASHIADNGGLGNVRAMADKALMDRNKRLTDAWKKPTTAA
jgi:hypothetical protein